MAVFTGIRVYGSLKPTLTCTLEEGGSFLANTKYYIFGVMRTHLGGTYNPTYGEVSDITEITTTSTAKSIRINHKTYRNYTKCENGTAGKIKITAIRHCLTTNDSIIIPVGSIYAGIYSVTVIDYDTFTIVATYTTTESGQFYTISDTYNSSKGMVFWISAISPIDSFGHFTPTPISKLSHYDWEAPLANDYLFTTPPTKRLYSSGSPDMQGLATGIYSTLKTNGTIHIDITATKTLTEIEAEILASGFIGCWNNATAPKTNTLILAGTLRLASNTPTLTITGYHIINICGEIMTAGTNNNLQFINCTFSLYGAPYQNQSNPYLTGGSIMVCGFSTNNFVRGKGTPFSICHDAVTGTGVGDFVESTPNGNKEVIANKIYWTYKTIGVYLFIPYAQGIFRNIRATNLYLYFATNGTTTPENGLTAYFDNITIISNPQTLFDLYFYEYYVTTDLLQVIKCRNIDLLYKSNNIKHIIVPRYNSARVNWYRTSVVTVKDEYGTILNNALVKITNKDNIEVSTTTSALGIANLEFIEQTSIHNKVGGNAYSIDDSKAPFTITVIKNGYIIYKNIFPVLYGVVELNIFLKSSIIQIDQEQL